MFYVGAQADNDREMLPGSFTVFSPLVDQEDAMMVVLGKVAHDLSEQKIDTGEGMMCFQGIWTWQEFADVKIADDVKMVALGSAVAGYFMTMLGQAADKHIAPLIKVAWTPQGD